MNNFNTIQRTNSGFAAIENVFEKIEKLRDVESTVLYDQHSYESTHQSNQQYTRKLLCEQVSFFVYIFFI